MIDLAALARFLSSHPAVVEKAGIHQAYRHADGVSGGIQLGDDCATISHPSGSGHLLFAAEGMLDSFVEDDPWFAGYCAVMVNLSDVAAMGGRPIAITDILWTPSDEISSLIWQGMRAAAQAYGVPIVGGHTTRTDSGKAMLGAAVLGHAGDRLLTSFHVAAGDDLVIAVDLNGRYHGDKPFWDASTSASPARLQADLQLLPTLAEQGICSAGKDISNGGLIGTLAMLCHCSGVGAMVELEDFPSPPDADLERWLISFPSYGYLLAIPPENLAKTMLHFSSTQITFRKIGHFITPPEIWISAHGESAKLDFGGCIA